MHKKLWVSVFLCLLAFSSGMRAQDKVPVIENLFYRSVVVFNETYLQSPVRTNFESSEPLFTFHVPPSPKSEAIYFDFGCQSSIEWWLGYAPQTYWSGNNIKIISKVIPDDIDVYMKIGMDGVHDMIHTHEGECRTNRTSWKLDMTRDAFLNQPIYPPWYINYKATGERVQDDIANDILNRLIDKGFDVRVTSFGVAEGVKYFYLVTAWIHVTRATTR